MSENYPGDKEYFSRHPWKYYTGAVQTQWRIQNRDIISYLNDFKWLDRDNTLPAALEYLRDQRVPVILDLMSNPAALISLHEKILPNKPKIKALSVGLETQNEPYQKRLTNSLGIQALAGDLNSTTTWDQINNWLGKRKVHLIMERGYGGLNFVPTYIHYYRAAAARLWNMLEPNGGVMLMQLPPFKVLEQRGIPIYQWLERVSEAHIYCQYNDLSVINLDNNDVNYGLLMLKKNPEAPVLPDIVSA